MSMVDWEQLNEKYPNKIFNGNAFDEMSLYLNVTDILITDASSCAFDFCVTKKPCFIFFPDLSHYKNVERGFYYDLESLPFPISTTFEELIRNISSFSKATYEEKVSNFIEEQKFMDDGCSAEKIVDYILSESHQLSD